MKVGSLCTGIGGLDLAAEAHFGAELAWYAEVDEAPWWVMHNHWPGVPNHGSIIEHDWSQVEPVDILTAGYPCQPFSHAGKRQGADDERHLWPYVLDAIHDLRPRLVVLENVAGHLSLGFDTVLGDLAEEGFDAEWCLLRASDVGAPHARARLFIVARDTDSARTDARPTAGPSRQATGERRGAVADPGRAERRAEGGPCGAPGELLVPPGRDEGAAPPLGDRPAPADPQDERHERRGAARGWRPGPADGREDAPDASHDRHEGHGVRVARGSASGQRGSEPGREDRLSVPAWGQYAPAIARWAAILRRPAPAPTDADGRLSPHFVEWMMGYPAGWVDGLTRTQALKALGNAVVPQQGYAALRELAPIMEQAA